MAAIVKPIEAKSIHQIQSGQVIVDLCSVVKELVENSLDAGANAIEVRFKNHGLDEIEVQDNGAGVAAVNYENLALKHYTSKLATYGDLTTLTTFGFRGEALSSLCALSTFTVVTAQANEAPKGHRLEFETSGRLKSTTVVACQKGTTACVQNLFERLPVRRKEMSKNIKREYGKVLGLLHAYACISTNVKFTVKNAMPKGKSMIVFATKSNATTWENIINVYGAKTLSALITLDLELDFQSENGSRGGDGPDVNKVRVQGHISKPVFGEGRQTPDRQMFFVNGRPCGLPQIAKAINEVYKSFNVSQSPFIFADLQMDTSAYDVNVSPDKRTILLHSATAMIETLKASLTELFENQDQTVPQAQLHSTKSSQPIRLGLHRDTSAFTSRESISTSVSDGEDPEDSEALSARIEQISCNKLQRSSSITEDDRRQNVQPTTQNTEGMSDNSQSSEKGDCEEVYVRETIARIIKNDEQEPDRIDEELPILAFSPVRRSEKPAIVPNAFDRIRPRRIEPDIATITIGDQIVTRILGSQVLPVSESTRQSKPVSSGDDLIKLPGGHFAKSLQKFNASDSNTVLDDYQNNLARNLDVASPSPQYTSSDDIDADEQSNGRPADIVTTNAHRSGKSNPQNTESGSDVSDADEDFEDRLAEEQRVAKLIQQAEIVAAEQNHKIDKRTAQAFRTGRTKSSVSQVAAEIDFDFDDVAAQASQYGRNTWTVPKGSVAVHSGLEDGDKAAEEQLSLTVAKSDFLEMHVVGQFNLGFILAVRPKACGNSKQDRGRKDELFIIDQHASDEKYNFERLQAETTVGNQRMVRPANLDLTAMEEEIVMDNLSALEKNGFIVTVDTSGGQDVGKRCQLVSLPISKEVVFGEADLDELIHLLAETPMLGEASPVPRPSKVRKMFAMRACRSSIMIGRTLSRRQMSNILRHLSSIDKPWNCPHGRPTMRHLTSLDALEPSLWEEGDGIYSVEFNQQDGLKSAADTWQKYLHNETD